MCFFPAAIYLAVLLTWLHAEDASAHTDLEDDKPLGEATVTLKDPQTNPPNDCYPR